MKVDRNETTGAQALSQANGALYGLFIGDALAMPVHWYYNRQALVRDYGRVTDFLAPKGDHPDSILWRSAYRALNDRGEILHDQVVYWGRKNVHYHQFLRAGENTLNVQIARLLIDSLLENGEYRQEDFLDRYIAFMTTPGTHRDTYIEECHRNFFTNHARGLPPEKCGAAEKHIGGLVGIVPIVVFFRDRPDVARQAAFSHLDLTHPGPRMRRAASLVADLLLDCLGGTSLKASLSAKIETQDNPLLGHPFFRWLDEPDERIVGGCLSSACYVEDAVPAVVYLALKYSDDLEQSLIANTNLGGDNAGRGAVLGALMGAAHGMAAFPRRWVDGLADPPAHAFGAVRP